MRIIIAAALLLASCASMPEAEDFQEIPAEKIQMVGNCELELATFCKGKECKVICPKKENVK